jgi:hypothetical protein
MLQRVKDQLNASTTEYKSPSSTNGDGHDTTEPAPKVSIVYESHRTGEHVTRKSRRAVGPQVVNGESLAALRAEGAFIIANALKVSLDRAAKYAGSNSRYARAWAVLEAHRDAQLIANVKAGNITPTAAAAWVKPMVDLKAAFTEAKATNPAGVRNFFTAVWTAQEHLKAAITKLGLDGTLDQLVELSSGAESSTKSIVPNAGSVTNGNGAVVA